jgi:gamma-glutamylcyclotransferase (GGCT)/AIG2-like uncharacterized protein YtfP
MNLGTRDASLCDKGVFRTCQDEIADFGEDGRVTGRMGDHIAFYGSLMREGGALQMLGLEDSFRFVGECRIAGQLYRVAEYPGLKESATGVVAGELYEVIAPEALSALDAYEDYRPGEADSLFLRRRVRLLDPAVEAWVYFYDRPVREMELIADGRWRPSSGN